MKKLTLLTAFLLIFSTLLKAQDRSEWFEFYLPWDDSTESLTNMSAYLDAPAGKHGFLEVTQDGHFKFQNATENIRFTGAVNVAIANFPSHEEAEIIAARMAKYGLNIVRIHLIDVDGVYGLFDNSGESTVVINNYRMDRLYYFTKCLKEKGIYYNFCMHSGRMYKDGDGIPAPISNNQSKYVTLFNPKIIALEKQYASQTLSEINPYTNLSYADDPAMISIELTNENQMFNGWFGWQRDFLFEDTPEGIGEYYSRQLDTLFNTWLKEKYTDSITLAAAWAGNTLESEELILNPSFEEGLTHWSTYLNGGGAVAAIQVDTANAVVGDQSLKLVVTSPGTEGWHVQLKTNNFKVEKDKSYKINFYSKGGSQGTSNFEIMENVTWKWMANPAYPIDTVWTKFEYFFTGTFDSDALILQFDWGLKTGEFWLDSVSVSEFGGIGIEDSESLSVMTVKRVKYSEIGKYSTRRVADNANFYFDVEGKYLDEMSSYLKTDLGIKCPITFTNNNYGLASIYSQSRADYMDTHFYWNHPNYPNGWSNTDFTMNNKSMLKDPSASTINHMLLSKVKNKPLVLSEYNHPYPYIFQVEAPSLLYAYGSYLDLDGIIWHAYYDYMNNYSQRYQDMFFDIAMHPVMMTQQILSIPYRLGYIKPAENTVYGNYKSQDIFDNTKGYQDESVINIDDVDYGTSLLVDGFSHASFDADSTFLEGDLTNPEGIIESDQGDLSWDGTQGIFTVNNPYWQGVTGFLKGKTIQLDQISLSDIQTTNDMDFASIQLLSLDSLPINESKKMILLTDARMENQGFLWNSAKTSPAAIGGTRALCEPVSGTLKLNFASRDSFYVFRLDERGQRSDIIFSSDTGNNWEFEFGHKTLWYEILNDSARLDPVVPVDTVTIDTIPSDTTNIDTTGIAFNSMHMKCYPNPCRDEAIIEFETGNIAYGTLILYDLRGRLVYSKELGSLKHPITRVSLSLTDLDQGMYFYGLKGDKDNSHFKKLIKLGQP